MVRERGPVWAPGQLLTLITESRDTRSPRELSLGLFSPTQSCGCGGSIFVYPLQKCWWGEWGGGASLSGLGRETGWRAKPELERLEKSLQEASHPPGRLCKQGSQNKDFVRSN